MKELKENIRILKCPWRFILVWRHVRTSKYFSNSIYLWHVTHMNVDTQVHNGLCIVLYIIWRKYIPCNAITYVSMWNLPVFLMHSAQKQNGATFDCTWNEIQSIVFNETHKMQSWLFWDSNKWINIESRDYVTRRFCTIWSQTRRMCTYKTLNTLTVTTFLVIKCAHT